MERTFPQKVKPVPSCEVEDGVMVSQIRQTPSEVNRLVRTSAAMLGLAISVGTCSLPLPGQSDEAIAAEPVAGEAAVGEPNASALPSKFDVAAISHPTEVTDQARNLSPSGAVEHTVQEGQTLWQLAQLYRVDAAMMASENGISVSSVLHVGQILKIQGSGQVAPIAQTVAVANVSGYDSPIADAAAGDSDRLAASQVSDKEALDTLKQKQERLRLSLAQLESSSKASAPVIAPESVVEAAVPSTEASYKVVSGDTLEAIATVHGVSLKQLSEANRLTNPNVLTVGQVLVVPQVSESTSPTAFTTPIMIASADPEQMTLPATSSQSQLFSQTQKTQATSGKFQPGAIQPASSAQGASDRLQGIAVLPNQPGQLSTVDQTVPAVSLNHSPVAPAAIGGGTEVATSSFVGNQPTQANQAGLNGQQSYVENLRLEIVKLREKYQGSASQINSVAAPMTKVAASSLNVAAPANPEAASSTSDDEVKPSRYTQALQAQIRQLQENHRQGNRGAVKSVVVAPVAPASKPQLVATASIGSESYEPLVQSSVGQMVSPNLPPLGSIDAYLPGKTDKFNGYIWPAKGVLTSGYGYRWGRMHRGIDIAAPVGTPIYAAAAGVVINAGWNSGGYGYLVKIQHSDGSVTLYAHNNRIIVREGQTVAQGQQIADMGSTGYSTGPHSHFEVHRPGQGAVNPTAYLPKGQA
ncbi:MAG: peptidoglycan DD-metalloendopeptidase family protein [Stenomitos frigidus ULC029]